MVKYFLSAMEGEEWKTHRSILSPIFTSGKLRQVFIYSFLTILLTRDDDTNYFLISNKQTNLQVYGLMQECGGQLVSNINEKLPEERDDVNLKMYPIYCF